MQTSLSAHTMCSGRWKPSALVLSPSSEAVTAFGIQAKLPHCPKQAVWMWLIPWDYTTGTEEASLIPMTLMLLCLMWCNSSCCLWDPGQNEGFISCLKSNRSCEKMPWHTKAMLRDELLLPCPQNGMWGMLVRVWPEHTAMVNKYHWQ